MTLLQKGKAVKDRAHITASGLEKRYGGRRVVKGVNMSVASGEVTGLLGPNGAGKTTVFYMLAGLVRADAGSVSLNDLDITMLPLSERARMGISYLPQERSVFQGLTAEKNISSVLELRGLARDEVKSHTQRLLEQFELEGVASSCARELSGGEARRLEIARAVAIEPMFMLMDEPFAGVDPIAVGMIQKIIKDLKAKGLGILISDHNVRETLDVCDRAYILNQGEVLVEGSPAEVAGNRKARAVYLGDGFGFGKN